MFTLGKKFNNDKICAAYISTWGVYDPVKNKYRKWEASDIDGNKLTDLILSFIEIDNNDFVSLNTKNVETYYYEVKKLVQKYPHLRVSIAIGGAAAGTNAFKIMSADSSLRTRFIENLRIFLLKNSEIRGIDIDWEYPGK